MLVLTVSKSLVSHDLECPQVSPSLPCGPHPVFLPPLSTVAAVAVPWCLVTSSEGQGSSVAVILVLDERQGEVKGAFKAVLTGVPKPQAWSPETWEKTQPQGCLDCVQLLKLWLLNQNFNKVPEGE